MKHTSIGNYISFVLEIQNRHQVLEQAFWEMVLLHRKQHGGQQGLDEWAAPTN